MKKCAVDGCDKAARSRGYCQTHYMRLHRHGTVEIPEGHGSKVDHPLYVTHKAAKAQGILCEPWLDFWEFVKGVSPVPEGHWRLQRKNKELPYSKENVVWKEVTVSQGKGETVGEYQRRRYHAGLRTETPEQRRGYSLKTNHGLTVDEYQAMLEAQGGVCAICGRPETKARKNGVVFPLAVDHCHKTRQNGKSKGIRGLLCQACNIGLGKFDDDPDLLLKAAAYLRKCAEK